MTKKRRDVSDKLKLRVLRRDGYTCVYCGETGQDANLEIDHRVALSNGGDNHISNLYTACQECNRKKGAQTWDVKDVKQEHNYFYRPTYRDPTEYSAIGVRERMDTSPLDGACLHIFEMDNETGEKKHLRYQGQVLGIFQGTHIAVKLFSFLDGDPTNVELFPIEMATNGSMVFYVDDIEMDEAHERWNVES